MGKIVSKTIYGWECHRCSKIQGELVRFFSKAALWGHLRSSKFHKHGWQQRVKEVMAKNRPKRRQRGSLDRFLKS